MGAQFYNQYSSPCAADSRTGLREDFIDTVDRCHAHNWVHDLLCRLAASRK